MRIGKIFKLSEPGTSTHWRPGMGIEAHHIRAKEFELERQVRALSAQRDSLLKALERIEDRAANENTDPEQLLFHIAEDARAARSEHPSEDSGAA